MSVVFVDSNILIYAHDADAGAKRQRAQLALSRLWGSGDGRLSVQVLQEFYVNVTKKLTTPIARGERPYRQSWPRDLVVRDFRGRKQDTAAAAPLMYVEAKYLGKVNKTVHEPVFCENLPDFC